MRQLIERRAGADRDTVLDITLDPTAVWQRIEADQRRDIELTPLQVGHQVGATGDEHRARVLRRELRRLRDGSRPEVLQSGQAKHLLPFPLLRYVGLDHSR